jgi:hypothetical protein
MAYLLSIVFYVFLFLGLCVAVVIGIAFINIFTKSFRPGRAILVIATISVLIILNGFLALDSLNRVLQQIRSGDVPGLQTQQTNNGALF